MFKSGRDLLKICESKNLAIWEVMLEEEIENFSTSREEVIEKNKEILQVMKASAKEATQKDVKSVSGIIGGDAKKLYDYAQEGKSLLGRDVLEIMALGLSTSEINAAMGKIVAAPTAGAAGIMPAVLTSLADQKGLDDDCLIKGLLTSGAIGSIIVRNASVSGAVGGCQAECGSAAAMAAAAIVEMMGGSPAQALDAASFALIHIMGLICDPIAGLVEYPCLFRNSSGAINAYISADMALAGLESLAPFDEVVEAMKEVGDLMNPNFKETALGGMANTPTGCRIQEEFYKKCRCK